MEENKKKERYDLVNMMLRLLPRVVNPDGHVTTAESEIMYHRSVWTARHGAWSAVPKRNETFSSMTCVQFKDTTKESEKQNM